MSALKGLMLQNVVLLLLVVLLRAFFKQKAHLDTFPFYPQKLALTSPSGGGRSVGIVRSRTKATEFSLVY